MRWLYLGLTVKIILFLVTPLMIMASSSIKSRKFKIAIMQNGYFVDINDTLVRLKKQPFKIVITLKNQTGVFMSASFNRDYFDLRENENVTKHESLKIIAIAENRFNEDQELVIDNKSVSYLFYDKELDWHRFDKEITINRTKVIGTKTINKLFVMDSDEEVALRDVNKAVYLFFVATDEWIQGETTKEFGRIKLKIEWE